MHMFLLRRLRRRNPLKLLYSSSVFVDSSVVVGVMCGQQNSRKMSVRESIEELSQLSHQLRRSVESTNNTVEKERLVLKHIKSFAGEDNCINDFQKGLEWFNVSEPLSVKKHLHGKITVLDFFTYCCINCVHILPDLEALEKKYTPEDGLVVVGVHSGKFANEKQSDQVLSAVQRANITHPTVNDAKLSMWRDIGISCWPSIVMLGPKGEPLFVFTGEGHREELFLYTKVCLDYFKSLKQIANHSIPKESARHLLPLTKDILLFPGKAQVYKDGADEDKLIVADTGNNRVLIMDPSGNVEIVVGDYAPGFKDGTFEDARFHAPQGISYIGGSIYVADSENHSIRKIDLKEKIVSTVAGTGSQGHDYIGGEVGTNQALSSPWDVAIYYHKQADQNVPVLLIAMAGIHQIWALFFDDTVWWKNKEYKSGTCISIVGSGREENRNNSYPHAAGLAQPSGLAVAQEIESVFFADSESSTVRRVHLVDGKVSPVCGGERNPGNLHDFGDVDGHRYTAKLQHPLGVAWDAFNKVVYIADTYNHKVKKVDIGGNCATVYGDGKPTENFNFNEPGGLILSSDGTKLYVADTNNHVVKFIDLENGKIDELRVKLPSEMISDRREKKFSFDATASPNGSVLNISFDFLFQDSDMKLNPEAPQQWTLHSLPAGWIVSASKGNVTEAISVTIPKGQDEASLHVILDLMTCKVDECMSRKLSAVFNVHRKNDAPNSVNIQKELKVE